MPAGVARGARAPGRLLLRLVVAVVARRGARGRGCDEEREKSEQRERAAEEGGHPDESMRPRPRSRVVAETVRHSVAPGRPRGRCAIHRFSNDPEGGGCGGVARQRLTFIDVSVILSPVTPKARPDGCCETPLACEPLPARDRDVAVAVCRALGDPTRLEIFRLVAAQAAPICVCDVVARFHLGQPTISHHLRVLREAGLVTAERRGVWTYHAVDPAGLARVQHLAASLAPEGCGQRP